MNNYVTSIIRTWVPLGIGALITWLSANLGFIIDEESQVGLSIAFTGFVVGLYYAVVRKLEVQFPQFGWLLGLAKSPGYSPAAPPAPAPGPNPDEGVVDDRGAVTEATLSVLLLAGILVVLLIALISDTVGF